MPRRPPGGGARGERLRSPLDTFSVSAAALPTRVRSPHRERSVSKCIGFGGSPWGDVRPGPLALRRPGEAHRPDTALTGLGVFQGRSHDTVMSDEVILLATPRRLTLQGWRAARCLLRPGAHSGRWGTSLRTLLLARVLTGSIRLSSQVFSFSPDPISFRPR